MTKYTLLTTILLVCASGCADKQPAPQPAAQSSADSATSAPEPTPAATAQTTPLPAMDPQLVIVEVNGAKLTIGQLEDDVRQRVAALRDRIPPERLASVQREMRGNFVDQFIAKTLLLDEADKRGIVINDEDTEEAFAKIRENLPEGASLEDIMKNSPLGEERMREEVLVGVRINKLLAGILPQNIQVTDEEIAELRAKNSSGLAMPESVKASHILFRIESDADADEKAEKLKAAEDVREQLIEGANFAELAKQKSDCPSSQRGGDLGTFRRGQMVKPFEDAAFSQEVGAIGPIVETKFGYHIIRVDEHGKAGEVPREQMVEMLKNQKGKAAFEALLVALRAKAEITYAPGFEPSKP